MPRRYREFAVSDARWQPFGELCDGFFAISGDEFAKGGEQRRMGKAVGFDAGERRFGERLGDVSECRAPFFGRGFFEKLRERLVSCHEASLTYPPPPGDRILYDRLIASR